MNIEFSPELEAFRAEVAEFFATAPTPAIREAAGLPAPATATVDARMATEERYGEGRSGVSGPEAELSAEEKERLRALGYLR